MSVWLCIFACFSIISDNEAARILAVFPTPSISHQVVFRPLTQELAKRGHDVTVITTDPVFKNVGSPPNLTEIDVHDISYKIWQEIVMKQTSKGTKKDLGHQIEMFLRAITEIFKAQLETKEVELLLHDKEKQFDLLLLEACARPTLALSYVYKDVPVILVSSLGAVPGNYELIGAPEHPFLYPNIFRQRVYNLSILEKIIEMLKRYISIKVAEKHMEIENSVLQKIFGPDIPSIKELGNNVDMLFLNVNPMM